VPSIQRISDDLEVTVPSGLAAIEARSGSGKIELLLPEKAAFQLEATAERGDAVNDYGPPIMKQSEGRSATLKGRVGDGPNIKIRANSRLDLSAQGRDDAERGGPMPPRAPKPPKDLRDSEIEMGCGRVSGQ
jgi:hypothetical protein